MIADLFRAAGRPKNVITPESPGIVTMVGTGAGPPDAEAAQRLSAFYRAVDLLAGDMSVLPAYVMDKSSRERLDHPVLRLLSERPNEAMTPGVRKYLLTRSVLLDGNAYDWIIRDGLGRPAELVPIPGRYVTVWVDRARRPWYDVRVPEMDTILRLNSDDVCHYKGPTRTGYTGLSVLGYARETLAAGLAAQQHNRSFYESGGQPSGIITLASDYSGFVNDPETGQPTNVTQKEALRRSWEAAHAGPSNAWRVAVLDNGMQYSALTINHSDAQFIEQQNLTVEDIARFFGVPLYKLMSGKQSYNSNAQNAVEYVRGLLPRITQMEEEQTYKLLFPSERAARMEIRYNVDALMRGDAESRAAFYRIMRDIGAYSVDDVLALEDRPNVPGGEHRLASLNYVPLALWPDLSVNRNTQPDADS